MTDQLFNTLYMALFFLNFFNNSFVSYCLFLEQIEIHFQSANDNLPLNKKHDDIKG